MMHTSADFATHVLGLLKNSGTTGHSGHGPNKPFNSKGNLGTTCEAPVVPAETDWSRPLRATGTSFLMEKQPLTKPVTSVTTGTANFRQGRAHVTEGNYPAEWHAILKGLKGSDPVEGFSVERWRTLINDAENFLAAWGETARRLGWTELDLFGVHPVAPAARFDVMGLIPILNGAAVLALTTVTATMRRPSGAILSYQRSEQGGAVLLSMSGAEARGRAW